MDIVHLLPDSVANQIAAGEVIQRPASVVKELVENSIDAGATSVDIIIKGAGRTSIQIIDNGKGMSATDARLAFERHATSKIKEANDLFALHTMGFRGEALASIAAVAQIELHTCLRDADLGTLIEISGSQVVKQDVEQCAEGTNFIVKNLFFNVPARRKFLKKDETELRNIIQELHRIVLANPNVAFKLYSGDDLIFDLPSTQSKQRIIDLFGKKTRNISQQLVNVNAKTSLVNITGYVGTPQSAGRNVSQFFFVNNRYMCHPYFRRAVLQAFDKMLKPEEVPQFFLYLEVDPQTIDVNIHPTKTEIKFENEREIWSIIVIAIKEALGKFNITPSIDFNTEDKIDIPVAVNSTILPQSPQVAFNPNYNPFAVNRPKSSQTSMRNWQQLFEENRQNKMDFSLPESNDISGAKIVSVDSERPIEMQMGINRDDDDEQQNSIVYRGRYIVLPLKSRLMIIDIPRAISRVVYDDIIKMVASHNGVSQKLLFPEILELSVDDACIFTELEVDLNSVGFEFSMFGKNMYRIEGVPALLPEGVDVNKLFDTLLEAIKNGGEASKNVMQELIADCLSLSASHKYKSEMLPSERDKLVGRLFASSNPNNSPNGEKIIVTIDDNAVDSLFNS